MRVLAVAVKSSGNDVYFAATVIVDLRQNAASRQCHALERAIDGGRNGHQPHERAVCRGSEY